MKIAITLFILQFVINSLAQEKKSFEYYYSNDLSDTEKEYYYPHLKNGKWGYVNKYGWRKIIHNFEEAYIFSEGLALIKKNDQYGFININGKIVFSCDFDDAKLFHNGYAWVKKNNKEALLKRNGTLFLDYWFINIEPFSNGYAKVVFKNDSISNLLNDKFITAYINNEGKQLSDRWFSGGASFVNGKAKVSIANEYFFLDTLGQLEYRNCEECDGAKPYKPDFKVDKNASFPGEEFGLTKFIEENMEYPKDAIKQGIQGAIFVKFVINTKGKLINAIVDKGVHPLLDKEALRIIKSLPNWTPAMKSGKSVCKSYIIPVNFQLH